MTRVLHVINSFGFGGSETQLLRILRDYDRDRFHMDVCTIGSEPGYLAHRAQALGAAVLSCPKSANLVSFSRRLERLIEGRDYRIVHAHFEAWCGPILRGAYRAGVPVRIAHVRSSGAQGMGAGETPLVRLGRGIVRRWGRHWIERYATHVLGVSGAALDARWPHWRANPKRFMVWTGGVDTRYFSPLGDRGKRSGIPIVICVGNFFLRSKRQDLVLRIFALVHKTVPASRLVFVGHGAYERDCRALADQLSLGTSVDFMGLRDRVDVLELLRSATVFLSCSESEGLSNVLLEAQSVGVPVVASDIPANREALAPELHPYLFKHDHLRNASMNVTQILEDPELQRILGSACRQHVRDHFDGACCLTSLEMCYENWVGLALPHESD